jgi:hypothetical protein|tara:strand:+ start:3897 stop:4772 length:876 start_codon:yes stop_codon:yes gene_type:complete
MQPRIVTIISIMIASLLSMPPAFAAPSSITEAEGYSCMGVDKSRKQTETAALQDAKRNAVEFSKTHIESESMIENFELKKDLVQAFSKANVKIIMILEKVWQDPKDGDCYTIRIQAEVVPEAGEMSRVAAANQTIDDPTAPLTVKVWTNKEKYSDGELMKVYVKGNKPFYGRLIYLDANSTPLQLLPNPYRQDNYFQGGVIYEVPQGNDKFDLTVQPPYGTERLTLYGSTSPLGEIEKTDVGPVFHVQETPVKIAAKTRGIAITVAKPGDKKKKQQVSEFDEISVSITTES